MVIGTAGNQDKAVFHQPGSQRLRIFQQLCLVFFKIGAHRFLQGHCFGCNHMHQRAALNAGKNCLVDRLGMFGPAKDHAATRPTQGLVGGRGHDVGVGDRAGMQAGCDQSGDMRHIDHEQDSQFLGDFTNAFKINNPRISAGAGHNDVRSVFPRQPFQIVIINPVMHVIDAIRNDFEIFT